MTHAELKETIRQAIINYKSSKEYLELTDKEAISNLNRILCENIEAYLMYFGEEISDVSLEQLYSIYRMIILHSVFLVREGIISDESNHTINFIKPEAGWLQNFFVLCYLANEIYDLLPDCQINDEFISYITSTFYRLKDDILQD